MRSRSRCFAQLPVASLALCACAVSVVPRASTPIPRTGKTATRCMTWPEAGRQKAMGVRHVCICEEVQRVAAKKKRAWQTPTRCLPTAWRLFLVPPRASTNSMRRRGAERAKFPAHGKARVPPHLCWSVAKTLAMTTFHTNGEPEPPCLHPQCKGVFSISSSGSAPPMKALTCVSVFSR